MKTKRFSGASETPKSAVLNPLSSDVAAVAGATEGKNSTTDGAKSPFSENRSQERPESVGGKKTTFNIYFDQNGKVEVDRMHDKSREQFKKLLSNPEVHSAFGTKPNTEKPKPDGLFDDEFGNLILDGISSVDAAIIKKLWNIPQAEAERIMAYSEKQKNLLSPPMLRFLNKAADKYQMTEEVKLLLMFVGITGAKFAVAKALSPMYNIKRAKGVEVSREPATVVPEQKPVDTKPETPDDLSEFERRKAAEHPVQ